MRPRRFFPGHAHWDCTLADSAGKAWAMRSFSLPHIGRRGRTLAFTLALALPASAVEPLPIAPGAKTQRMLAAEHAVWARRVWVAPFQERTAGESWQREALAIIEEILAAHAEYASCAAAPKLIVEAERVRQLGCKDPLLDFLILDTRHCLLDDHVATRRVLRELLPRLEPFAAPRGLAARAGFRFLSVAQDGPDPATPAEIERSLKLVIAAVKDASYAPDEWHLLVQHAIGGNHRWIEKHGAALLAALAEVKPPEWVDAVFRGYLAVGAAWESRGDDLASGVTKEGWKGFHAHLADARRWLTHAWELRPDRPEAAAQMVTVAMGGGAGPGETTETWLERARAAVCDHDFALNCYVRSLLPRWGGSHAEMFAFAERCLATGRFDTHLPTVAVKVGEEMNRDYSNLRRLYREPRMKRLILAMSRGLAEEPTRERERAFRQSFLAVNAWLCGEPALAGESLARLPGPLHPRSVAKLREAQIDERAFRGELAVASSPAAEHFPRAVRARENDELAAAKKLMGDAFAVVGEAPAARSFLEGWLAVVTVEETLARGEWAEIPATADLHGWMEHAGRWRVGGKGLPEAVGDDRPARLVFGARVGPEFELRAEFSTAEPKPGEAPLGVYFGHQFIDDNFERWHACNLFFGDREKQLFGAYLLQDGATKSPFLPAKPAARYVVEVQVRDDRLSWKLNGQPLHEEVRVARPLEAHGRIGIGSFHCTQGFTMTLEKLAVRRLAGPRTGNAK